MVDPVTCMLRAATRKPGDRLHIVTAHTHERLQSGWSGVNAHFWHLSGLPGFKESWNPKYAAMPPNFTSLPPCRENRIDLPDDLVPDLILAQHRFGQFQALKPLADFLHVPLMTIEHTLPRKEWGHQELMQIKQMRGDLNAFITADNRASWGWSGSEAIVVEHGIDTELFRPNHPDHLRHTQIVTVANDYVNRGDILGFDIWQEATRDLPTRPFGDTPGLSTAPPSVESLADELAKGAIFLCTARSSPIPMSLLEAMSCGMACVSIRQSTVATVVRHGENGFLADSAAEVRQYLLQLRSDKTLRFKLGQAARQTVLDRFPLKRFQDNWEEAFRSASEMIHLM